MNDNVYIRHKTSIKTISLTRLFLILPLIIYGCYKNGVYLYLNKYVSLVEAFKPLILIMIGALVGALVNIIYLKLIKRCKDTFMDVLFSSFHIEYGILLACVSSINTNIWLFAATLFIFFFISKFFKNRVNIMCIIFIIIYILSTLEGSYTFFNSYETSKIFSLNLLDYLTGRAPGGIASTHIILLLVAFFGLHISNTNKSEITIATTLSYSIPAIIYAFIVNQSVLDILFLYNYLFIFTLIATDSVTSCYTTTGKNIYGILIGVATFALRFFNPVLAPFISILIISLFNNLIDRLMRNKEKINYREEEDNG